MTILNSIISYINTKYYEKCLIKGMSKRELDIFFSLIEILYRYIEDVFIKNIKFERIPKEILRLIYTILCDITENSYDVPISKLLIDIIKKINWNNIFKSLILIYYFNYISDFLSDFWCAWSENCLFKPEFMQAYIVQTTSLVICLFEIFFRCIIICAIHLLI